MPENKIIGITIPPYEEAMSGGGINKKGYKGKYGEDITLKDRVWSKENLAVQRERITQGKAKKEYKGRLSFFKRLSLAKGNLASAWEDILIGVRT